MNIKEFQEKLTKQVESLTADDLLKVQSDARSAAWEAINVSPLFKDAPHNAREVIVEAAVRAALEKRIRQYAENFLAVLVKE